MDFNASEYACYDMPHNTDPDDKIIGYIACNIREQGKDIVFAGGNFELVL